MNLKLKSTVNDENLKQIVVFRKDQKVAVITQKEHGLVCDIEYLVNDLSQDEIMQIRHSSGNFDFIFNATQTLK